MSRACHVLVSMILLCRAELSAADQTEVPMTRGVTFVLAVHTPPGSVVKGAGVLEGDYEMVVAIDGVSEEGLSQTAYFDGSDETGTPQRGFVPRLIRTSDLAKATLQIHGFHTSDPRINEGTTSLGPSLAVTRAIADNGSSPYAFRMFANDRDAISGTLQRADPAKVKFPVIINGQRVDLTALRATGYMELRGVRAPYEMLILDDPRHPLSLRIAYGERHAGFPFKPRFAREIVRIDYPEAKGKTLEESLDSRCRVEVPGIYFDFNRDSLKPQSQRALETIASAVRSRPDRKLVIEGHTDDVGSDAYNDDLSTRRAAAVRKALVSDFQIDDRLLEAQGYGEHRPVESNETIAGRARNRRVELACAKH